MRKFFVHGLSALDLIQTVSELPKYAEKYKSNSVHVSIGGNAANASVALSRLGVKVFLSTVIGNDEVGNILKQKLLSENIDLSYTHYVDNFKTSISSIIIDKNGERLVLNNREFNDIAIKKNIDFEIFDGFLFDSRDIKNSIKILEWIKNIKKPKVLDAEENTTNELLNYFSHVVFSYQGLKSFIGIDNIERALKTFAQKTEFHTLVTNGEHGCYYIQDKIIKNIPAIKIKAVDTLAAGDVWHASFLFKLVKKYSLVNSIEFANYIASLKCKKFGGSSGSPFLYEINENFDLIQVLGNSFQGKKFNPVINQNTGFNLSILKAKRGKLENLKFSKPAIMFSQKGNWQINIDDFEIKLNYKDTISIPINTKVSIEVNENDESLLNCVTQI